MAQSENRSVTLPDSLRQQFAGLEQRLWKIETTIAVCVGIAGLGVAYLALFVSDRLWESPVWLRCGIAFAALILVASTFIWWLKRWVWQRRDWKALAILVQRRFRRLGDRLLGIVELSSEKQHDTNFSPELYRAAIRQVAEEAGKYQFHEAVEVQLARRCTWFAGALMVATVLSAVLFPAASLNALTRLVAPFSKVPRFTLVGLAGIPDKLVVPHGENFDLTAKVDYHSFWKPSHGQAQFAKQPAVDSSAKNRAITFHIPGQTQPGVLKVTIGDATKQLFIEPSYRPSLKEISASVQLPEYLQYPATNRVIPNGTLALLEGSTVSFHGKVSRELALAQIQAPGHPAANLKINGDEFSSDFVKSEGIEQHAFNWQDKSGLSNASPWKLVVQAQKDLPPVPELPEFGRDIAMLFSDVLSIRLQAHDDYGVNDFGLSWDLSTGSDQTDGRGVTEMKKQSNTPHEKRVENSFEWAPAVFGIPPDSTVELTAYARDFLPNRDRAESPVYHIHVLGNEQHAELVRQRLESVLSQVEEISRLEDKIAAKTAELRSDKNTPEKQAAEKINGTKQDQEQNAKNLDELSHEGMAALHEAMKNPVFTEDAVHDWSKIMKEMSQLSQKNMQSAASDLKSAQDNAGNSDNKSQNLASAQKKEEEILKQLEQMQAKVNKGLDDLQALTLAQRLRKVSSTEKDISGELQKLIPESIGLLPSELTPKVQRINSKLADNQDDTQKESQRLEKEINRFFERTQKKNYGDVSKEMKEQHVADALDRVRALITDNVGMEATRNLGDWDLKFTEWANKLEPPKDDKQSGGSQGQNGGQKPQDLTKQLIALLRMREGEIGLQQQTHLLDEQKGDAENYKKRAEALASTQGKMAGELGKMEEENKIATLAKPLSETHSALSETQSLLAKPQTDKATDQSFGKNLDLLTDLINLINEQAQRNPPPSAGQNSSQPSAEDMAFLMKMMQQQNGPVGKGRPMKFSGGGNTSGGTTDRTSSPATGNAQGKAGPEKNVQKASGAASISLPVEFREQLENYFKALEQEPE